MIIFFHGNDNFRLSRAINEIKNKFIKDIDPQINSLILIDGQNTDLKELSNKISSGSLFVKKRLIIINNLFKNKKETLFKELLPWLEKIINDEYLILVFKEELNENIKSKKTVENNLKGQKKKIFDFLKNQKYSQELNNLSGNSLKLFIQNELKKYDKKISLNAAEMLISSFGNDLWILSNELKKLSFLNNNRVVSLENIKEIVKEKFNENIFSLTDALGTRNKNLIFSLLEKQKKAGLSDDYILTALRNHIKNLLLVMIENEKTSDSLKIASKLKIHPFVVKKLLIQIKNFNKITLKNYFNYLINIDFNSKKGVSSIENELFLLIAQI